MDGHSLTEEEPSDQERQTIGAIFGRLCPYYLAIGMTYDEFWNGDVSMARAYRKAHEYRRQQRNEELWIQGAYVYQAICAASPILRAFAKSGTKPSPYLEEPFPLTRDQKSVQEEAKKQASDKKALAYMEMFMISNNKKFEKGGNSDGRQHNDN